MKHYLTLIALGLMAGSAWGAGHVSTEPQKKRALIEEFTGINCVYCPVAHTNSRNLELTRPGTASTVAIHYGAYSNTSNPEYDFRVNAGGTLHTIFQISGYPTVIVSRRDLSGSGTVLTNYSAIAPSASKVHEETAKVNLWAGMAYDAETREIKVDVEAYFREEMKDPSIAIYLVQNNIYGPQTGSTNINDLGYNHMHVLRDMLTDTFGDDMECGAAGDTYTHTFTYTLPEKIKEVPTNPANMAIVAYVLDEDNQVENVTEAYPTLTGMDYPNNVLLNQPPLVLNGSWGYSFFEAVLENNTDKTLTEAKFLLTVGLDETEIDWKGEIAPHSSQIIEVPIPEENRLPRDAGSKRFRLDLLTANGEAPSVATKVSASVRGPKAWPTEIRVQFDTDHNPSQNVFAIRDFDGNIVHEFGPYEDGKATHVDELVTLENDKDYCFQLDDKLGDGITTTGISFYDTKGTLLGKIERGSIDYYGARIFFYTDESLGIGEIAGENGPLSYHDGTVSCPGAEIVIYDLSGTSVAKGLDSIDLNGLGRGVYMAVANGQVLKVLR